jgi:hypothetical protein
MQCPVCDCCEVSFAGVLGDVGHARCRDCGIVYTFAPEECDGDDSEVADYVKG